MHRPRPLGDYPAATLNALSGTITALLRYQEVLPTDLYVKLDLFRDDIRQAVTPCPRRSAIFTPHPATPDRPLPAAAPRPERPRHAPNQSRAPHGDPSPRKAPR